MAQMVYDHLSIWSRSYLYYQMVSLRAEQEQQKPGLDLKKHHKSLDFIHSAALSLQQPIKSSGGSYVQKEVVESQLKLMHEPKLWHDALFLPLEVDPMPFIATLQYGPYLCETKRRGDQDVGLISEFADKVLSTRESQVKSLECHLIKHLTLLADSAESQASYKAAMSRTIIAHQERILRDQRLALLAAVFYLQQGTYEEALRLLYPWTLVDAFIKHCYNEVQVIYSHVAKAAGEVSLRGL